MCAIHHRAFDSLVVGIRPDFMLEIRRDVREERHALQGLHGNKLTLPRFRRAWPDTTLLEERFERFRAAS
jgi:putative restriction endonuclease